MSSLDPLSSVITALKRESIIPDVLPETFTPTSLLSVIWPNNKEALLGNELEKADVAEEPEFRIIPLNIPAEQADSDNTEITYTIAFFDPDAPSRADAKFKSFRHWVVSTQIHLRSTILYFVQITGLKLPIGGEAALASKPATTPYRPPAPGPGTNYHRYSMCSPLILRNAPKR
jgi:phosphatidylethanolamine-binding protein